MYKICFITTVSITLKSFVLDFAEYLHKTGNYEIWFVCDYNPDFEKSLPKHINFMPIRMKRGMSLDGIKAILGIYKFLKQKRFDLVQYSTPNASFYASVASKMAKVPVRLYCQWGMAYVGFKGINRIIFKSIEKIVCHLSTWIEPDSKSNLQFAHEEKLYPKKKGSVVWNGSACGIDLNKFCIEKKEEYRAKIRTFYSIPTDAFVFGFVGRITRDKGINELLTAYKRVTDQYTNTYLMFVGSYEFDGSIDSELLLWAQETFSVVFTGYSNVVEQMLSAMDCYVLPSYREGFGMGTIEAEAMGVPVIVTSIPGTKDAVIPNETGLIIEKKDAEGLYQAMIKMIDRSFDFGEKGVTFVKENFERQQLFGYILEDREKLLTERDK